MPRVRDGLTVFRKIEEGVTEQMFASEMSGHFNDQPSMAKQAFKEECDINTIVRRFGVTGQAPASIRAPSYGDFTGVSDYQTALNALREAEASFGALPAEVRKRFDNDPQQFVEFCSDEKNMEEMRKLGLTRDRQGAPRNRSLASEVDSGADGASSGAAT